MVRHDLIAAAAAVLLVGAVPLGAAEPTTRAANAPSAVPAAPDLGTMSLEDLMSIDVTSVSRHRQKISEAPAAVTVISQEDIERSGLHSIPELLRLAPGLDVARIDARQWAITSRGFNLQYANKLLVLMDGRTLYQPLVSGASWDQVGYVTQDLDRIEVIRGPGATMWGANAVNGVINITSKSARDTQGVLVSGLASNVDDQAVVRYGGRIDEETFYRAYGMFSKTNDFVTAAGDDAFDGFQSVRGGFRVDRFSTPQDTLTLQGDLYRNLFAEQAEFPSFQPPFLSISRTEQHGDGQNILGRWTHTVSPESEYSLQAYYDRFSRHQTELGYVENTFDVEFQHRFPLTSGHSIMWGAGARYMIQTTEGSDVLTLAPADQNDHRLNVFVQDDITIVPERLHATLGAKLEYSSFSEFEYQPSARLLWTPNERHTVWAGVSRAVHTPTPAEQSVSALISAFPGQGGVPTGIVATPNHDQKSEELLAFELGYRLKPTSAISIDLAGFYNRYDNLQSADPGTPQFQPTPSPRVIVPVKAGNGLSADSYGLETSVNFQVNEDWRLAISHSFLVIDAHTSGSSTDTSSESSFEGSSPRNQVQVHSYYNVTPKLELNASAYYTETLPSPDVASYVRVDLGMTWRPRKNVALSLGVQNLFDDRHPEFGNPLYGQASEFPRTVYGQFSIDF